MKKFLFTLFAALSISVAANAGTSIVAFSDVNTTQQFCAVLYGSSGLIYDKCEGDKIAEFSTNSYYNSKNCAPNWAWSSCFKYCFSYNGTTYFFNFPE